MEGMLSDLPTWGLLVLGVVWLAFQFVQKFLENQGKKREEKARAEYRSRKSIDGRSMPPGASVAKAPTRPSEDTGRHDLRAIIDDEREREQRAEILMTTRQHSALLERLVAAETGQTELLRKLVEMQGRQDRLLEELAKNQRAIVQHLGPAALDAVPAHRG